MSIIQIGTTGYTGGTIAPGDTVVGTGTVSSVVNGGSLIVTNTGTLSTTTGGSVEVTGSLSGTGVSEIGGGGTLQVDGPITQGTISFGPGAAEILIINDLTSFAGTISGIRDADVIAFGPNITLEASTVSATSALLVAVESGATHDITVGLLPGAGLSGTLDVLPANEFSLSPSTYLWNPGGGGNGNVGVTGNWQFNGSIAAHTPQPGDIALFGTAFSDGGTLGGTLTAGVFDFRGLNPWVLQSGNALTYTESTQVGGAGNPGSLEITQGATLQGLADQADFVDGPGAGVLVSGTTAGGGVWTTPGTIFVGDFGDGTLTVGSGGLISAGTVIAGGQQSIHSGNGWVTVQSGGTLQVNAADSTGFVLGSFLDSNGSADVTGLLNASGAEIILGDEGSGTLSVGTGGSVIAGSTDVASTAIDLGHAPGASGTLNVDGGIVNAGTDFLTVGDNGAGAVTVSAGGRLSVGTGGLDLPALDIGENVGSTGTVTVTGTSSVLTALGQLTVGDAGQGVLMISGGGSVISGNNTLQPGGGIAIGFDSGGNGELVVTGAGSELNNTGQFTVGGDTALSIAPSDGGSGFGTMLIQNGGTVATNPGAGYTGPAADIAADTGTDGSSVSVTGPASTWTIGGSLIVGDAAAGSLGVTAGGSVSAASLIIGGPGGGSGDVGISGATSTLSVTNDISVGGGGIGNLHVNTGANIFATDIDVGTGSNPAITGEMDVEGASSLNLSGDLNVGGAAGGAAGLVLLGSGVNLNVGGENINAGGVLVEAGDPTNGQTLNNAGTIPITSGDNIAHYSTAVFNSGVIQIQNSATYNLITPLITHGTASPSGAFVVGNGSTGGTLAVDVSGTFDNSQTISFTGSTAPEVLVIGSIASFGAEIGSITAGSELLIQQMITQSNSLGGVTAVSYGTITAIGSTAFDAGSGPGGENQLLLFSGPSQSGSVIGTIDLASSISQDEVGSLWAVNAQGGLGADNPAPCFAAGTRIRTARGEVAVEDLRVGDDVPVLIGGGASRVVWIGQRLVDCGRHPEPRKVWPVRVRSGAFGPGLPGRDLYLSPDHALYVEEVLIPVRYLVDGEAIAQVPVGSVTYYHIELERHDVVLAEGLPAESFLDTGGKRMFDNGWGPLCLRADSRAPESASASSQARSAFVVLHPDFAIRLWEAEGCAPLVVTGPEVVAARRRLSRGRRAA